MRHLALVLLLMGASPALAQISEDYTTGAPAGGWTNATTATEVHSWQIGRQINGTEAAVAPHPITEGAGPSVLTFNIREQLDPGESLGNFQTAQRPISFDQADFKSHVLWLEYSSFSNVAVNSQEAIRLNLLLQDQQGVGLSLGNLFNTRSSSSFAGGTRANQLKPRRAVLDEEGNVLQNIDGNAPQTMHVASNLNYQNLAFDNTLDGTAVETGTGVLNTLFNQQVVIRLEDYDNFNVEAEWRSTNPTASGDANWRSFTSGSMGSGVGAMGVGDALVVTNPLQSLTTAVIQATRRDISGRDAADGQATPQIARANAKIDANQASTNGVPNEQAEANQQVGLGKFILRSYHRGDINRDGAVTTADITGTTMLANFGQTTISDPAVTIGLPDRDVSWVDGDSVNTKRITVGDALAGVLLDINGAAPTGPVLVYDSGAGNLKINANGASISGFALLAKSGSAFNTGAYFNPNPNPGSALETVDPSELGWINLTSGGVSAGADLTGMINLGDVMPAGLSTEGFASFFSEAVFNVGGALTKASSFFAAPGLAGDFDEDGDVDGNDFLTWQRDPGVGDLADWRANFGAGGSVAAVAAIPEPATATLAVAFLAIAAVGGRSAKRYRRS